jgi:hypothetical protein
VIPAVFLALALPAAASDSLSAERARRFLQLWKAGDHKAMYESLTASWRKKWPYEEFDRFFETTPIRILRHGSEKDRFSSQIVDEVSVKKWDVWFDPDGKISGMLLTTEGATVDYPAEHERENPPAPLRFPFEPGQEWTATGTHHKIMRSQRFALDLRIMKDGSTYSGPRSKVESYHAYGKTVLSPADGLVIQAIDEERDSPIAEPSKTDGNRIVIKVRDNLILYLTHLKAGSFKVASGDRVKAGQPLAQVGNTGHSTEPHLHIEAFDSLPRPRADAWPLVFENVVHNGKNVDRARIEYGDSVGAR